MKPVIRIACAGAVAASFAFCAVVLSKANGIHAVFSDGHHLFEAGSLVQRRALFGVIISVASFGAIALSQFSRKQSTRVGSLMFAFVLMSLIGVAISIGTLRQFT